MRLTPRPPPMPGQPRDAGRRACLQRLAWLPLAEGARWAGVGVTGVAGGARAGPWLLAALGLGQAGRAQAQTLQLVTEEEVARDAASAPVLRARSAPVPDAPRIRVLAPTLAGGPLGNPIRIDLAFTAAADAEIDPASFRIQYGALRIDLTDRLLTRVKVLKSGLQADQVVIPAGSHRLLLRIADTQARVGEAELRFSVQ